MRIADLGRFSEPALHIMASLLEGPRHGYAMADDIEQLTGRRPGPGTLYRAINRLEAHRLIRALPGQGRRRPYTLTRTGLEAIRTELAQLARLTREGQRRLRVREAST